MDTANRCKSLPNAKSKSKLARTFHKVISFNGGTAKIASTNAVRKCSLPKEDEDSAFTGICSKQLPSNADESKEWWRRRQLLEALVAKLFAEVTTIKAAYAELQMAEQPYRSEDIQAADQVVVDSLKQLSEIKQRYIMDDIDHLSPPVTLMLAQIQEQQSLMKTYELTARKLERDAEAMSASIISLRTRLRDVVSVNNGLESRLQSRGSGSLFDGVSFEGLGMSQFVRFLPIVMRSVRSFVKVLVREMEAASWDIDMGVKAIEPTSKLHNPSHRCFVFESYVCRVMFEGFNHPKFTFQDSGGSSLVSADYYSKFKKVASFSGAQQFLVTQNRESSFCRFLKAKYLILIHAKMESSLFGNLNQRKMVSGVNGHRKDTGQDNPFPDNPFFLAFAEMARRVWCLNLLAFSYGTEVKVFRVREGCRFSEAYMECIAEEGEREGGAGEREGKGHIRVGFTVVPGFKIGKNLMQSQVYLRR